MQGTPQKKPLNARLCAPCATSAASALSCCSCCCSCSCFLLVIQPVELQQPFPIAFNGIVTTTTDVWETLRAARDGDLARLSALVAAQPVLACCKYNYAPPIHFAVREGHTELVRFLLAHGGLFPSYQTDLFRDDLVTMAFERGHADVNAVLIDVAREPSLATPCIAPTDDTRIHFPDDDARVQFRRLLDDRISGRGTLRDVESALEADPSLATDPFQCWGEGVLATSTNAGDVELIDLLDRGMNPNHMNWHHVTLLHEIAFAGDMRKAQLLVDRGADINPVDEEYQSTPLALAARNGKKTMVRYLLDRGADHRKAGAEWATPAAWAKRRGHSSLQALIPE